MMTRLYLETELKRRKLSVRIQLFLHQLRWKLDNADPAVIGFWACLLGVFLSQVVLFLIG